MKGYWWKCEKCGHECKDLAGCPVPTFIHDQVIERDWNQDVLRQDCPECHSRSLLITYEFPRKEREVVSVLNIVGLRGARDDAEDYVPMVWATRPESEPGTRWLHFNYMRGRNPFGLKRAAVFCEDDLRTLAELYETKTGRPLFPSAPSVHRRRRIA